MNNPNRITNAKIIENHTVELTFDDNYVGRIDLTPTLWGPVFEPLKDLKNFCQFRLEDDTIRWPNDADFCPDVLRFWCESGGVKTQQETDCYFAKKQTARAAS
jgi:hypothetical protein